MSARQGKRDGKKPKREERRKLSQHERDMIDTETGKHMRNGKQESIGRIAEHFFLL
jgi:hypothetical protein